MAIISKIEWNLQFEFMYSFYSLAWPNINEKVPDLILWDPKTYYK